MPWKTNISKVTKLKKLADTLWKIDFRNLVVRLHDYLLILNYYISLMLNHDILFQKLVSLRAVH
jgi:hypothetical protein